MLCAAAVAAALAVLAAATTNAGGAVTGTLRVTGPWTGADEQSFRAVLQAFEQQNPGLTVTYTPVSGSVASAIEAAGNTADVAVLSLPNEVTAMRRLARAGTIQPIEFAVPAVRANYAFTWKAHGSVDGKLYGLFFKATNRSGFWYDQAQFRRVGLTAPTSWRGLQRAADRLTNRGIMPFAVSGRSAIAMPDLFANTYLMLQGNRRYDMLTRGQMRWSSGTVRDTLRIMRTTLVNPSRIAGGLGSLSTPFETAVQKVFGSPLRAGMVTGGSAVMPVLYRAKAVRPVSQFGVIPFPTTDGKGPARVIGAGNAVVMVKNSEQARALINYLATPEAATIWAKRGIDFLSPNRKVDVRSYPTDAVRTLASALTQASVFRFGIADMRSTAFKGKLNQLLIEYVHAPRRVNQITAHIDTLGA
jgi:ABC-type glycerol-3-phosphate transport system substrate-binding protein